MTTSVPTFRAREVLPSRRNSPSLAPSAGPADAPQAGQKTEITPSGRPPRPPSVQPSARQTGASGGSRSGAGDGPVSTPTTPPALLRYRERHVIRPMRDWWDDFRRFDLVCENDGIRVHPIRGGYRHDRYEVQELVKRERGEPIRW